MGRVGRDLGRFVAALFAFQATAAEVVLQNDSWQPGDGVTPFTTLCEGEQLGAYLDVPAAGRIVGVQVYWTGGPDPSVHEAINIDALSGRIGRIDLPAFTPGALNEFRHTDPAKTQPLDVPVFAGERIRVAIQYSTEGGSVGLDPQCSDGSNGIDSDCLGLPGWGCDDSICFDIFGDFIIRAILQPAGEGACCLGNGSCVVVSEPECASQGGAFLGEGASCTPTSCGAASGACCPAGGGCTETDAAGCAASGGTFGGGGTTCATHSCAASRGACCLAGGGCREDFAESSCTWVGGTFGGAGSTCATAPCAGVVVAGLGHGAANPNRVRAFTSTQTVAAEFDAYATGAWGVNVAAGKIDADAAERYLTGPGQGPQFGPHVRGFGDAGTPLPKVSFYAYGTLRYGVRTVTGEIDGDGFEEIFTAPGPGAVFGPHVRGWDHDGGAVAAIGPLSYFAFGTLRYGANAGTSDVDADGAVEMLVAPGPSSAFHGHVRGFAYDGSSVTQLRTINFLAFASGTHGAEVAGGDADGDGRGDAAVATGPGPLEPPIFRGFGLDPAVQLLPGFETRPFTTAWGGRVGLANTAADFALELLAAPGPDPSAGTDVAAFGYDGNALVPVGPAFPAFPGFTMGAGVAGGRVVAGGSAAPRCLK